jgi:hypothetical protein
MILGWKQNETCEVDAYISQGVSLIKLPYGVIGNTSGFGPEESRFEPWWGNYNLGRYASG